jgi:hypothetical protein
MYEKLSDINMFGMLEKEQVMLELLFFIKKILR